MSSDKLKWLKIHLDPKGFEDFWIFGPEDFWIFWGERETESGDLFAMQEALEENRQHLVRALRAVELTTAETREEASQAVERVVELEGALDVQAHTVRDLREQVYALQLRAQRSADERATHQQGQDLALLAGRLARLEEAAPPVEERVAGCETRAGEMQVGLENLGSWVQSTLQQRAVESERQMSIMHIAMQTYVQQQIESSLSERLDTDIADLKQSVVHLTEDNASLREQVSHQIESASERLYQQMEVSSERLAPEIADLKESVAHLQEENANLREQVANSQAAIPSDLPSPGTTSRIEEALSSPRVEREDKEAPRPKSPATPREASKDLVAQESAARDQRLAATIDQARLGPHLTTQPCLTHWASASDTTSLICVSRCQLLVFRTKLVSTKLAGDCEAIG